MQHESFAFAATFNQRNWPLLLQRVMTRPSPWEELTKPVTYKKKFSMCGAFEQPLISRVQATDAP